MNKVIQELADICRNHRFEEKLVFVPSYATGHRIGEALAREGHAWINLRPTIVLGYAQELVGLELARDGVRLIDSRERLLIIEEIFRRDGKLNGPGAYFKSASEVPGILKCLADSTHELRMEGFDSAAIDPECFLVPKKGKALRRLLKPIGAAGKLAARCGCARSTLVNLASGNSAPSRRVAMRLATEAGISMHSWDVPADGDEAD